MLFYQLREDASRTQSDTNGTCTSTNADGEAAMQGDSAVASGVNGGEGI